MTDVLAQLFIAPISLSGFQKVLLVLPLCLAISIVYKATRLERVKDMPVAVLGLWATIVVGMYAVGMGLWAVHFVML